MIRLPRAAGIADPPPGRVVAMASRLELRRLRDVPAFLLASLRLRRRFRAAAGGVGLALAAEPMRRTFWTCSEWTGQDALRAFTGAPAHVQVMRRFRPAMAASAFVTRSAPAGVPPGWGEARARIAEEVATGGGGGSSSGRARAAAGGPTV